MKTYYPKSKQLKKVTFGDIEIKKQKFQYYKNLFLKNDVDITNIQVSSNVSSGQKGYKYFIGYTCDDCKIQPL